MVANVIPLPRDELFPGTLTEFIAIYGDEGACARFLRRWKYGEQGFRCPRCGHHQAWFLSSRRIDQCMACRKQVSLTAGTVMHGTRKPLALWFLAIYEFVVSKQGVSALELSRRLGVSYPTAWTWLHKLRCAALNRPKTMLRGTVEADET